MKLRGNVIIHGTLRMHPSSTAVTHRLQFIDIRESRFRGGGIEVLAARCRPVGCRERRVGCSWHPPGGAGTEAGFDALWRARDEIRIAPYRAHDDTHFPRFKSPRSGSDIPPPRLMFTTEVFNLTRNIIIGGTRRGLVDVVFLMRPPRQHLSYIRIEHVGPRVADPSLRGTSTTVPVPGRYGSTLSPLPQWISRHRDSGSCCHQQREQGLRASCSQGTPLLHCVAYRNPERGGSRGIPTTQLPTA